MEGLQYYITRSDPSDLTSALEFFPPKGSDDLHEALKHSYPHLKNLQARMRQAVIEFYLAEHQEQTALENLTSPTVSDEPTPEYVSFGNMTPFTTAMSFPSTPAISGQTSPDDMAYLLASFSADMPPLFPQASQSPPNPSLSFSLESTSRAAVPTQEELTNVWALSSKPDAKVHKRRCMTKAEKAAYKQKRVEGACADCKRRRRRCKHNTAASSSNPASLSSSPSGTAVSKSPTTSQPPINCAPNINCSEARYTSVNTDFSMLGDFVADLDFSSWDSNAGILADDLPYELPVEVEPPTPFEDYGYEFIDFTRAGEPTLPSNTVLGVDPHLGTVLDTLSSSNGLLQERVLSEHGMGSLSAQEVVLSSSSSTRNSICSTCWMLVCAVCHSSSLLSAFISLLVLTFVQNILLPYAMALLSLKNGATRKNTLSGALSSLKQSLGPQHGFQALSSDKAPRSSSRKLAVEQRRSTLSLSCTIATAFAMTV